MDLEFDPRKAGMLMRFNIANTWMFVISHDATSNEILLSAKMEPDVIGKESARRADTYSEYIVA